MKSPWGLCHISRCRLRGGVGTRSLFLLPWGSCTTDKWAKISPILQVEKSRPRERCDLNKVIQIVIELAPKPGSPDIKCSLSSPKQSLPFLSSRGDDGEGQNKPTQAGDGASNNQENEEAAAAHPHTRTPAPTDSSAQNPPSPVSFFTGSHTLPRIHSLIP